MNIREEVILVRNFNSCSNSLAIHTPNTSRGLKRVKLSATLLFFMPALVFCAELKPFEFDLPVPKEQPVTEPAVCEFEDLQLPAGLKVYAAGAYSGRKLEFQIDQSGHVATQFDVAVNSSDNPVALLLGAYEPTIWNIGWSSGTNIVAVLVSGYHRQIASGLSSGVPIINSTRQNGAGCGYFYIGNSPNRSLNPISRRLFEKPVDLVYPGDREGRIVIGDALTEGTRLVTSADSSPESFRDESAPVAGLAGLADAVEKGLLRLATTADVDAWLVARALRMPNSDVPPIAGQRMATHDLPLSRNAYVVLEEFTYPAGLFGANSATFFIPGDVSTPKGNRGHSTLYVFKTFQCFGPLCQNN